MTGRLSEGRRWGAARMLAAELAQYGMDDNLVKTAAGYMKAHPDAAFVDWLERLVRLGELFRSSDQTDRYRQQLWHVGRRVAEKYRISDGQDWAWILGWGARLLPYYDANIAEARRISPRTSLDTPPAPYQPQRTKPAAVASLPEVREKPSDAALSLFERMQQKWAAENEENEDDRRT